MNIKRRHELLRGRREEAGFYHDVFRGRSLLLLLPTIVAFIHFLFLFFSFLFAKSLFFFFFFFIIITFTQLWQHFIFITCGFSLNLPFIPVLFIHIYSPSFFFISRGVFFPVVFFFLFFPSVASCPCRTSGASGSSHQPRI